MHAFSPLTIRGRSLIPIVQGGMGVGISASSLSSAVAGPGLGGASGNGPGWTKMRAPRACATASRLA